MKSLTKAVLAAGALLVAMPQAAVAQDQYPLKGAEWIEVTGISLEDGGGLQYANWLAGEWRKRMDYAVSQGWIESYEIWSNTHARQGEPDMWLLTRFDDFESNEEFEARNKQMRAFMQRNIQQLQAESGDRAKYRTVLGDVLIKRLVWRD
ncbi:hypothetical protein GRI42_13025 [Erythrobacter gaetbuli]|uniref:NIPSNAP domain-containing protein n=1 Tax=Qipengyuania gaetbuli TaxID=266952 RepID=A0A844Y1G7_9SPHN|nr:hypothetical protein [Qipengyuania gaetbuli]MXO52230.1 hypothetical protein [Qipengyuania gaetbuli]